MAYDEKKYFKHLNPSLTDEQKMMRLQKMKEIFENQIESAFGTHPVQLCAKESRNKDLQSPGERVKSRSLFKNFKSKSAPELGQKTAFNEAGKNKVRHAQP